MNIQEIKDLMKQFDNSSLHIFCYKSGEDELSFSKNIHQEFSNASEEKGKGSERGSRAVTERVVHPDRTVETVADTKSSTSLIASEGELVESPLIGVVYLAPAPNKPVFVAVGDNVKKGQTLMIIEAMKVMNEIAAPKDGVITEVLVSNEELVDFGKGLVRIK